MDSDKLLKLFRALSKRDSNALQAIAWEAIEDEKRKKHHLLARQLENILAQNPNGTDLNGIKQTPPIPRDNEKGFRLLDVKKLYHNWNDVILSRETESLLKQIVDENTQETLLATYGLKPKRKILFFGPPGTGKTLSAKVISSVLGYPLVLVRFDSVISSYLGETASNLRKIFDFTETGKSVVLFDEFDIIGKQRDDPTEHGEIKRVVNNFMLMIENYEGDSLLIASTNHPQLLDVGLWRRFDEVVYFGLPNKQSRKQIFDKYLRTFKKEPNFNLGTILDESNRFSGADIEQACVEALKREILVGKDTLSWRTLSDTVAKQRWRAKAKKVVKYE